MFTGVNSKTLNVADLGQALFSEAGDVLFVYDPHSNSILEVNPATVRITGFTWKELLTKPADFLLRFSDPDRGASLHKAAQTTVFFVGQEGYLLRTKQDGWIPVNLTVSRLHLKQRTVCLVVARDVREQHKAHLRLQAVETELRRVLSSVSDCLWSAVINDEGQWTYQYISPVITRITGHPPAYFAANLRQWLHVIYPEDRQCWRDIQARLRAGNSLQEEFRIVRSDGVLRWVRNSVVATRDANTKSVKLGGVLTDVTENKEAEEKVRRSTEELQRVMASVSDYVWSGEVDGNGRFCYRYYSPVVEKVTGRPPSFFIKSPNQWLSIIHLEDRVRLAGAFDRIRAGQSVREEEEYRILLPDGSMRWVRDSVTATRLDRAEPEPVTLTEIDLESGAVKRKDQPRLRIDGVVSDITERKRAEAALHASEAQLRQAQKMEAVGRLAGGIAHDFNNLLTIILGFSEMAIEAVPAEQSVYNLLQEIYKSGQRAADLTKQLLAFSRKQLLQPVVLHVGEVVGQMKQMLQRLIGEDVELVTHIAQDAYLVKADAGQLEQVLMNLAANARDAMPRGGKLVISASNTELGEAFLQVHPEVRFGSYLCLEVQDTGVGMDSETLAHIFEPFYTTKEVGRGTGLGLATVYGIVKQSDGYIYVESKKGQGSKFQVYLPRAGSVSMSTVAKVEQIQLLHGSETILLVEDEYPVRRMSKLVLQQHGYTVVDASNGQEALELARQTAGRLDLLVTDVIMPGMNGRDLANTLCKERPELRVLYISGYPDEALGQAGTLDSATILLAKPFTPETLARKVREILRPVVE